MSWMSDEWKESLPNDAISHITAMEKSLEKFRKEISQYHFKNETLESSIEKFKRNFEEQEKEVKLLEREKTELGALLDKEQEKNKQLTSTLNRKDDIIKDNAEAANTFSLQLEKQKIQNNKLQKDIDLLKNKLEQNVTEYRADEEKLNEASKFNKERIEELKHRLDTESREHADIQRNYEEKLRAANEENEKLQGLTEAYQKEIRSLEIKLQTCDKEKNNIQEKLKQTELELDRISCQISNEVGDYLGIPIRKFTSEPQMLIKREKEQLLKENKVLLEKLEELEKEVETYKDNNKRLNKSSSHNGKLKRQSVVDSGVALREHGIKTPTPIKHKNTYENQEIIISRIEPLDSQIESPCKLLNVYGDRGATENQTNVNSNNNNNASKTSNSSFKHSNKCVMLSEELFENKAVLNSYKDENAKLKHELSEMESVYENHIKVCKNVLKKSQEKLNSVSQTELIESLNKKLFEQDEEKCTLNQQLEEEKKKCRELEDAMKQLQLKAFSMDKLDELVDIIFQKRSSLDMPINNLCLDDKHFELSKKFSSLQEHICKEHHKTTERVKKFFEQTAEVINLEHSSRNFDKNLKERRNTPVKKHYDEYAMKKHPYLVKSGNAIEDLDNIRCKIESVQQNIYMHSIEVCKLDEERDRLQEELVKMVELVKRKDEEIGRLTLIYEQEKRKVNENESCFKREMNALKHEQLEIYQEFREMCENLKKKDIELLNKSKQMKLMTTEWREKEDTLNEKILHSQEQIDNLQNEKNQLEKENSEISSENNALLTRLNNSEVYLRKHYERLQVIEDMLYRAKAAGLYE